MKKQIIPIPKHREGLNLNKRTISNLNTVEMNQQIGGGGATHGNCTGNCTNRHTCGFGSRCGSSYAVL